MLRNENTPYLTSNNANLTLNWNYVNRDTYKLKEKNFFE